MNKNAIKVGRVKIKMMEIDYLKTDLEKVSYFHDLLVDRATGRIGYNDKIKSEEFIILRELVLKTEKYKEKAPEFLLTIRTLDNFWLFIRDEISNYAERRKYLKESFSKLLVYIEFGEKDEQIIKRIEDKAKEKFDVIEYENELEDKVENLEQKKKIFISHSSKDKEYATELVDLLERFGISSEEILCTSVPGTKLKIGTPDFLIEIKKYLLATPIFICLFSENYLNSPICLCEMGAAWITSKEQRLMLTPETDFSLATNVVLGRSHGMKINETNDILEMIEGIQEYFGISKKNASDANRIVDRYLRVVNDISEKKKS